MVYNVILNQPEGFELPKELLGLEEAAHNFHKGDGHITQEEGMSDGEGPEGQNENTAK